MIESQKKGVSLENLFAELGKLNNKMDDLGKQYIDLRNDLKKSNENVNISTNDTQEGEMEDILKKHFEKYPIKTKTDGRYYSYLPDESHSRGRRDITNKTKEGLINAVKTYYINQSTGNISFNDVFYKWIKYKENVSCKENTIKKYKNNYLRFFCKATKETHKRTNDANFLKKSIREIRKSDVEMFLSENIKLYDLKIKAFNSILEILSGVFTYAYQEEITDNNVMDRIDKKALKRRCRNETRQEFEKGFMSTEEAKIFFKHIYEYHKNHPDNMRTLAVLFQMYTGCRVGEVGGLLWSDIYLNEKDKFACGGSIDISHSLKEKGRQWVLSTTKTGKERTLAITKQIADILQKAKDIQEQLKCNSEYVFAFFNRNNELQLMTPTTIENYMRDRCKEANLRRLSPTMLRKQANIAMISVETENSIRVSVLGHTPQVNRNNYTYNSYVSLTAKEQAQQNANNYIDKELNVSI